MSSSRSGSAAGAQSPLASKNCRAPLLLRFFGKGIELPFFELVSKLCNKVLLPVAVGQALRATPVKDFYEKRTNFFKRLQEVVLLGIVWNAFCNAFTKGLGLDLSHAVALLVILPLLHIGSLVSPSTTLPTNWIWA